MYLFSRGIFSRITAVLIFPAILVIFICCIPATHLQSVKEGPDDNSKAPKFKALVLYENGGHHIAYSIEAKKWLDKLAADSNFAITYIQKTDTINDAFLAQYQLFIQLDYAPY
ncbi:MAG: ThuA protein, partial [Chitinophagaceae bacterium]|nr:ThuA protein [Chitinophagaceae bacterium]